MMSVARDVLLYHWRLSSGSIYRFSVVKVLTTGRIAPKSFEENVCIILSATRDVPPSTIGVWRWYQSINLVCCNDLNKTVSVYYWYKQ